MKFEMNYNEVDNLYNHLKERRDIIGNKPFRQITAEEMQEYHFINEFNNKLLDWLVEYEEWIKSQKKTENNYETTD